MFCNIGFHFRFWKGGARRKGKGKGKAGMECVMWIFIRGIVGF